MELLLVILSVALLCIAAARWPYDSRDGFSPNFGRRRFRF